MLWLEFCHPQVRVQHPLLNLAGSPAPRDSCSGVQWGTLGGGEFPAAGESLSFGGTWAREGHPATELGADPCVAGNKLRSLKGQSLRQPQSELATEQDPLALAGWVSFERFGLHRLSSA